MIWRERRGLLIVLGLLLAANIVFFFTYRVQYQQRLTAQDERLAESEANLRQARTARILAERQLASYRRIEHDVAQVYDEQWSTPNERLTRVIAEVKRLALAANLVPKSYGFDRIEAKGQESGSRKVAIGATEVGISFSVEGTYDQVRRLVNLLELSNEFIIIDQIALSSTSGTNLTMNLHLKTLFRSAAVPPPAGRQS